MQVPVNALSAQGLATPWVLSGGCHEADPNTAVFVQGAIFDPATKAFSVYNPLVIDVGTTPAITPVAPSLPQGAIVGLFGGGNGNTTTLLDTDKQCANGADGKVFGQVFYCNTQKFFQAVKASGVAFAPLGKDVLGVTCPSVRSFAMVDQDQSDNVQVFELATSQGQTAQDTAANRSLLGTFATILNPSDNLVLTNFIDPAIGCHPLTAPNLADDNSPLSLQALDELQAAAYQKNPVALIPAGDPMVGPNNLAMVNAYRTSVDQPPVHSLGQANTQAYCAHLREIQPTFLARHKALLQAAASPATGVNLYDFLIGRFHTSLQLLHCHGDE